MKNKNLLWIGLGTVVVVGVTLFFLVKANKNKLVKKEWESVGSPGTLEDWSKMSATQKEAYLKSKGVAPSTQTQSEAQQEKEGKSKLQIDTSGLAKGIADLFVKKNQELLAQSQKEQSIKSKGAGLKKQAQSQFGTQI